MEPSNTIGSGNDAAVGPDAGTPRKARVVVVGAGIAGLTAAAKLIHNGIKDVLVLEAQDYVGGRIRAQAIGNTSVEMGAMFVHGQVGNPVFEIIEKLGLVHPNRDEWPPFFYTNKKTKVPIEDVEGMMDYIEEKFDDEDEHDPQIGQNRGQFFADYRTQFLQEYNISYQNPKTEIYDAAFRWMSFYDEINEGVDSLEDVSEWVLANYYKTLDGPQETLVKGGYSKVIQVLHSLIPDGVVITKTPVQTIVWADQEDGGMLVRCTNGDVIKADHVIVTISMGCLKDIHNSMFVPNLPSPFVKTMEKMRMGTIGKIFLKWDTPFWAKNNTHFDFLWLPSSPVTLKSDKSKRKTRLGKFWWQYIAGPQRVAEHEDILVVWLSEHQLDAIRDLDDQEIIEILCELMQVFLYDMKVTMPNEMIRSNWKENPFIRGAYAYPIPSFDTTDTEHISLPTFPSTQNPRLMFAGEAYNLNYATSVHGAFITGEQQADNVLHANDIAVTVRIIDTIRVSKTDG